MLIRWQEKKGQAIIEMLPMIVIFLVAISASIAYFQMMRNAILVQEAARNAAFAKINNSGPMVTPPARQNRGVQTSTYRIIAGGNSDPVLGPGNSCITVFPGQSIVPERLPVIMGDSYQINETTRAVVYRLPGSSCQ